MKNRILGSITILGLFFMLAMANVQAQTSGRVEVTVPFDFSVGKATLKAGAYTVKTLPGNALAIRSADGKTTALVNAPLTIGARDAKAGQRLVFNQYGDQYFLSQVWLTVETGRQLFTTRQEEKAAHSYQLANNGAKARRVEIATRTGR
jgi:hypothetical protein